MRLVLLAAAVAALTAVTAPAFAQNPNEAAAIEEFKRGQAAANAKNNEETIKIMTGLITANTLPKEWAPFPYFYRGQAERRMEKYNDAIADFEKATTMKADLAPAWFETGMTYYAQKKYKPAIAAYDKAVKIDPNNAEYVYSRCVSKSWANDNAGARTDCQKATQLKPDYLDAWATLARAYEDLGQTAKAVETYKKVLEMDPKNAAAKEALEYIEQCSKKGVKCD